MPDILPLLTLDEQRLVLDLARRAIAARLGDRTPSSPENPPPRLLVQQGAFVTLHLGATLRGCVGMVAPLRPLVTTVMDCAAAAATEDPRFSPLDTSELERVTIEISALNPPFRIADPTQITLGRHGLMITAGRRRGLLLPQVAVEQGWDVTLFLEETCAKAGLPADAWIRGAIVEAFSAQVFSEPIPASY